MQLSFIICTGYHARLTIHACIINQSVAIDAASKLLESRSTICSLRHIGLDRLMVCGKCDKCRPRIHWEAVWSKVKHEIRSDWCNMIIDPMERDTAKMKKHKRDREWRENNRERDKQRQREWRQRRKEKAAALSTTNNTLQREGY